MENVLNLITIVSPLQYTMTGAHITFSKNRINNPQKFNAYEIKQKDDLITSWKKPEQCEGITPVSECNIPLVG